jgi:hypothetical protein
MLRSKTVLFKPKQTPPDADFMSMASILKSDLAPVLILICPQANIKSENSKRTQAGNITGTELPLRGTHHACIVGAC